MATPVLRPTLRRFKSLLPVFRQPRTRQSSSSSSLPTHVDPATLLSTPTWSVKFLLPATSTSSERITPSQLHHLLRLSALPLPQNQEEEDRMISVLQSQLAFVRDVQSVKTDGVEPLQSIRDETEEGLREATIGLETLREALASETVFGRRKRRRRQRSVQRKEELGWDPLETASRRTGRFFVVKSGKVKE
ncbi:hypothetical protein DL546_002983 [Coniochaeta pulveracea]|uniref:Glutamyl-tRNA amidotransferase complex subunit Gta3 domain-containing protein n=1 Tax=Coniochaeta pulveracea TaxID=177199 RepID=A0A420Y4V2_9PEZI|nr:hypothetical protein DL546_002983 [Coniochaeta pulveracea]